MKRRLIISLTTLSMMAYFIPSSAQNVVLGTGTSISVFSPLNRTNDYCVYEVIYLQSQINLAGPITTIGFQRHDGTNTDSIENVRLYLKHTNQSQIFAGNFDTTGYSLVYTGSFPNDAGAGWREVLLDSAFTYNNNVNLQVLVVKDYQPAIANTPVTPRWIYTNINPSPARARRYYGAVPITNLTSLTTTAFTSNARLTFNTTAIAEIKSDPVSVYPNPSGGSVNFNFNTNAEAVRLLIYNTLGTVVSDTEFPAPTFYQTYFQESGIYFYVVQGKGNRILNTGKIIITD